MEENHSNNKYWIVGALVVVVFGIFLLSRNNQGDGKVNGSIADPVLGATDAVMVIREYTDFQCPACGAAYPEVKKFVDAHMGEVRLEVNDFPLPGHKNARVAAYAANCANAQGKFFEFEDSVFKNQSEWSNLSNPVDKFKAYINAAGGDAGKLETCTNNKDYQASVDQDVEEGKKLDINGTPTFFVNGERQVGGLDLKGWEAELAKIKANSGPRK
ncbi:MAG: thioredoxin domain-containing protein [bacterium]